MMKQLRRLWFILGLLLIVGALILHPSLRWRLLGWARGEAFYQGRPTSYWEGKLQHYQMVDSSISGDLYFLPPKPTKSDEWLKKYLGVHLQKKHDSLPLEDPAAVPVLVELLSSKDLNSRLFAIQTLGYIGPEASRALPTLRELRRSTQEYLVYREAGIALSSIDGSAGEEVEQDRPDREVLWKRYIRAGN